MIGAIIRDDMVENLIVLNEAQVEELSAALSCEIVDARPYGLTVGDLRTAAGWTRNADGEQIVLELLEQESYDGYTLAMQRALQAEAEVEKATDAGAMELLDIITGEEEL